MTGVEIAWRTLRRERVEEPCLISCWMMKRDIERCFQVAGPGGGFCLASSSSILPETPLENIRAFMEYGREYGRSFLKGQ